MHDARGADERMSGKIQFGDQIEHPRPEAPRRIGRLEEDASKCRISCVIASIWSADSAGVPVNTDRLFPEKGRRENTRRGDSGVVSWPGSGNGGYSSSENRRIDAIASSQRLKYVHCLMRLPRTSPAADSTLRC